MGGPHGTGAPGRRRDLSLRPGTLLLKVTYRNLARADGKAYAGEWLGSSCADAWNHDWIEFSQDDAAGFVGEDVKRDVPETAVRRLARNRIRDHVQGHGPLFRDRDLKKAQLTTVVVRTEGDVVTLRFEGESAADDGNLAIDARLLGRATYDRAAKKFTSFELVALATRQGSRGGAYRHRHGEREPGPLGVAFTLETPARKPK